MSKSHAELVNDIRLNCSDENTKLFLNSTGKAYPITAIQVVLKENPELKPLFSQLPIITYGLAVGGHDIIGIRKIKITPDMVGQEIGVFCGIEVKTEKDKLRQEQKNFDNMTKSMGCFSGTAREPNHIQEAKKILCQ